MSRKPSGWKTRQAGFTMLEILVTVVVLSIGLLGLAGMQVIGLQYNHSAYLRSQATLQANDIADRMRANSAVYNFNSQLYNNGNAVQHTKCEKYNASYCTLAEIAENDLFVWNQTNASVLPGGSALPGGIAAGVVCRDSAMDTPTEGVKPDDPSCDNLNGSADPYVIKIWWVDDRSGQLAKFMTVLGPNL